jgi:hypothetical protein
MAWFKAGWDVMRMNKEPKPKLTDAERYKRFLDAAKEVGASDDLKDFDRAFERIVKPKPRGSRKSSSD